MNEIKLCECGCGRPAPIAKKTKSSRGARQGQPQRFCHGHGSKGARHYGWNGGRTLSSLGYVLILIPEHPKQVKGYVREHVLMAEQALGRYLPPKAVVHHVNEITNDNRNENLVVCENNVYHQLLHVRLRAYQATGNPNARKCHYCHEWGGVKNLHIGPPSLAYHRACKRVYEREGYTRRRAKATGRLTI